MKIFLPVNSAGDAAALVPIPKEKPVAVVVVGAVVVAVVVEASPVVPNAAKNSQKLISIQNIF